MSARHLVPHDIVHDILVLMFATPILFLQDFPELAGEISGMDDPADAPWRLEVSSCIGRIYRIPGTNHSISSRMCL